MNTLFDNQVKTIETKKISKKPLNKVKEETYDFKHAYDMEIAHDIVFELWVMKWKEFDSETDLQKKTELQKEIDMLHFEKKVLSDKSDIGRSVMDKIFRLYGPILKNHYATI
jgi:hypothetical protein